MKIALHIGANCTDEDKLLKTLLKNSEALMQAGIRVPGPGKYRRLLRETIQNLDGAAPEPGTRDILMDAIVDGDEPKRLVLSNSNFICIPNRIFDHGLFYEQTEPKLRGIKSLFPNDEFEVFIGIRNPATFLPDVFRNSKATAFEAYLKGFHVTDIRWSDVIKRIRHTLPDSPITVWCNEDTPMIWSEIVRAIAGIERTQRITGGFDLLATIMAPEGMKRFLSYIQSKPPHTEAQKRKIIAAFLDKYALDEEIETEVDLPGIDDEMVESLTEIYDQDVEMIGQMPGVRLIQI